MDFQPKEKYTGINWNGDTVSFNKTWGGHLFTDEECSLLLKGETIALTDCVSKNGKAFGCYGRLEEQTYNGHIYWGFKRTEWLNADCIPDVWCNHRFTDEEKKMLSDEQAVLLEDAVAGRTGRAFSCYVRWAKQDNGDEQKYIIPVL